jgi:hypothetical protein
MGDLLCVSPYTNFLIFAILNFNNVIIKKNLHKISNIVIAHSIKKPLVEEIILFDFILCDVTIYLFKNNTCKLYWKTQIYFLKNSNDLKPLTFHIIWTMFVNHVKKFFYKERHDKYVINRNLTNNHIHMEDNKHS